MKNLTNEELQTIMFLADRELLNIREMGEPDDAPRNWTRKVRLLSLKAVSELDIRQLKEEI